MPLQTFALSPLILCQALWTAARASRLPEAAGPRESEAGAVDAQRFLILGDSSAAGVGVSHQSEALAGQLARAMCVDAPIGWKVIAKSGATVRSTLKTLSACPPERFDFVLIALGVNDTKNGVSLGAWQNGYRDLIRTIDDLFGTPLVCVSGLPPIQDFPLLPDPLRSVLGARAERFDACLQSVIKDAPRIAHLPVNFPLETSAMAADGFHPGPAVYRMWAERAADVFAELQSENT
ncbi:MAG: SGNH/GDSL hydrolase family protein [Pseudomonadota bacterium]